MKKQLLAVLLCWTCGAPLGLQQVALAQNNQSIEPVRPQSFILVRPYQAVTVPPVPLGNSARLATLIRAGKLYLTVQDAIALALENNIDIEVSRYTPVLDEWNLERAEAGGALPGVPSASSQASSVVRGQGVRGSQAAAGVSANGSNGAGTNTVNATVTQIGPVTPTLDPVLQDTTTFSHLSQPQANLQQSVVSNLIDKQRNYATTLQTGFLTGTQASLSYTHGYLNENAPTDILNPQFGPTLKLTLTQQLLQGFGVRVNRRNIDVDKLNLTIDDLNFKSELISVVVNVLNLYYSLVADGQDVRAKQSALDVAKQFYENNRRQVELGAMAPLDVTSAESQVALSEQNLENSRATLEQAQVSLKNALSRTGTADPILANVDIVPLDHIDVPQTQEMPPLKELVAKALRNRVDIQSEQMHLTVDEINGLGLKNNLLPVLAVQASASSQGLSGTPQPVPIGPVQASSSAAQPYPPGIGLCPPPNQGQICELADASFKGGIGTALGQMFRRDYPSQGVTAYMFAYLRNRQAQADYAIDRLSAIQDKLQTQKDLNQIAVDVSNGVTALQQARVRYLAAVKNHTLQQQLFDAEQKKFALGASTSYLVVSQQRDLVAAQSSEIAALQTYSNALIGLGQTVGTTLDDVHLSINEAKAGAVHRASNLPTDLPAQP